jgi:hypothetical protein
LKKIDGMNMTHMADLFVEMVVNILKIVESQRGGIALFHATFNFDDTPNPTNFSLPL